MKYLLLMLMVGCASNWNFAGISLFNTNSQIENEIDADQRAMYIEGARELTPEEKRRAKIEFDKHYEMAKNVDVNRLRSEYNRFNRSMVYEVAAGRRDWRGWGDPSITLPDYIVQNPLVEEATKDGQFLLWQMYKLHPTFVLNECARGEARQAWLKDQGKSWVAAGKSKHNQVPSQACDIVSVRKTGKKDFKDTDALAAYQGIAVGLGEVLSTMPCEVFGSKVTRVIDWKTVRDLYHIEFVPRPECVNQVTLLLLPVVGRSSKVVIVAYRVEPVWLKMVPWRRRFV